MVRCRSLGRIIPPFGLWDWYNGNRYLSNKGCRTLFKLNTYGFAMITQELKEA